MPQVTPRQVSRTLEIRGTERTPAPVHVAAPDGTSPLGLTIVHTSPKDGSGYSPPLRRWRVAGNTVTSDSSAVSGGREPLHPNPVQYKVPTSAVPQGGYLLCAFVRVGLAGSYRIYSAPSTELPPSNDGVGVAEVVNSTVVTFPVAHTWQLVPLSVMTLPTTRTPAGLVYVGIQRDASETVDMLIDEAWLFRVDDDCALTIVEVTAANLWLNSPDVDRSVPTIWVGDSEATRHHPASRLVAHGDHTFSPDATATFVATLEVDNRAFRRPTTRAGTRTRRGDRADVGGTRAAETGEHRASPYRSARGGKGVCSHNAG